MKSEFTRVRVATQKKTRLLHTTGGVFYYSLWLTEEEELPLVQKLGSFSMMSQRARLWAQWH